MSCKRFFKCIYYNNEFTKNKVAYNVFNVGDTKENYTKQMIVDEILKVLPNSKIKYIKKMKIQETTELILIKLKRTWLQD